MYNIWGKTEKSISMAESIEVSLVPSIHRRVYFS